MEYRIAGTGDIELLVQSRADTLRAVNRLDAGYQFSREFLDASRNYFLEGDQETVLALENGRVAGCATMCYIDMMPMRRQGIAYRMVSMLIESAWKRGATEISLDATEAGRPLYRKLGFTDSGECMVLEKD